MSRYVDADALKKHMCMICNDDYSDEPCDPSDCVFYNTVAHAPTADVAPVVHGRWGKVYRSGVAVKDGYVSSCCDMWNNRKSNYCPNCGAKMDAEG